MSISHEKFAKWIEEETGIVYSPDNYFQLKSRVEELMAAHDIKTEEELFQRVITGIDLKVRQQLLDISTNNETSFFRDQKPFDCLRDQILPQLAGRPETVRIWSAASSSGQEAYSVAMTVLELQRTYPQLRAEIIATDISQRVIMRTADGIYSPHEVSRGLPKTMLEKYFVQQNENWRARPELRQMVQTKSMNLCRPFAHAAPFDIVFCRNVLIYQNIERKKTILNAISRHLRSPGYLFLGAGESTLGISDRFCQDIQQFTFYRLIENKAA